MKGKFWSEYSSDEDESDFTIIPPQVGVKKSTPPILPVENESLTPLITPEQAQKT